MTTVHTTSNRLLSARFSKEDDNYEELDTPNLTYYKNETSDSCDSEISEYFLGFPSVELDKLVLFMNFLRKKSKMIGMDLEKRDIIDGVVFLSFTSEESLLNYSRQQEELRASSALSDDGLEIPDDGSYSDISSSHAIVPTKTKDITRIKGWRTKHFVAVNLCDDSASSLRNDDDGFGDDLEMKSIRDDSSEDAESVDYPSSTALRYRCGVAESSEILSQLPFDNNCFNRIESSVVEDCNAVDNAEESRFSFRKSLKKRFTEATNSSDKSFSSSTCLNRNSTASSNLLSSTTEEVESVFTIEQNRHRLEHNEIEAFDTASSKEKSFSEAKSVYKPRVKLSFLEVLESKVKSSNSDDSNHNKSVLTSNQSEPKVMWRVPRDKLISGNIFDVVASPVVNSWKSTKTESIQNHKEINKSEPGDRNGEFKTYASLIKEDTIGGDSCCTNPFQSKTLDEFTTNFGELHINFTIPKLDASDTVTHEEIELPKEKDHVATQIQKVKPKGFIKAKTLAEKRRLIAEMTKRAKRKQKISVKQKDIGGSDSTFNSVQSAKNQTINKKNKVNKEKSNVNSNKLKKDQFFDKQGVITYGQEKPLLSVFNKNKISFNKRPSSLIKEPSSSKKMAIILNIGLNRPLYKEGLDNITTIFDEYCDMSKEYAGFAVSAVQSSTKGPFKVTRFLVPVAEEYFKELKLTPKRLNSENLKVKKFNTDVLAHDEATTILGTSDSVAEGNRVFRTPNLELSVLETLNDIVSYVEKKESFDCLEFIYDPDVPASKEESFLTTKEQILTVNKKTKKSKLQRQMEQLGCTFISVQNEECNEENLRPLDDNDMCTKDYCKMGCVCSMKLRREEHCHKSTCMFLCQCSPVSKKQGCDIKNKVWLLPNVLRIQSSTHSKLAKVEREYHQTVIMSESNKTIMLENKHKKRERKVPSKFKDGLVLDYIVTDENHEKMSNNGRLTRNNQPDHGLSHNSKVVTNSPVILPLDNFLKSSLKINKDCFIRIEKNMEVQKMAIEFCSRRTSVNNKCKRQLLKVSKQNTKNVARKKTGASNYLSFSVENQCSRTCEVSGDYNLRNILCTIKTRDMFLYSAGPHSCGHQGFHTSPLLQNEKEPVIFKEDLLDTHPIDEFQKDEMVCLEKKPNEEGCQLAIGFVCTLAKEEFDNQGSESLEEDCDHLNSLPPEDATESKEIETVTDHQSYEIGTTRSKVTNKQIVYAALPTTESENKWWVVKLDKEKFSFLSYCSDKQLLLFDTMNNASFISEYNKKLLKIPLNKPLNNDAGKFGAYAVPGHKHLIFFGPYDVNESHGITAVKLDNDKFINVPFTTKFKKYDGFKSLGIFQSESEDSSKNVISDKHVYAVWWYSTHGKIITKSDDQNAEDDVIQNIETESIKSVVNKQPHVQVISDKNLTDYNVYTDLLQQTKQPEVCFPNKSPNSLPEVRFPNVDPDSLPEVCFTNESPNNLIVNNESANSLISEHSFLHVNNNHNNPDSNTNEECESIKSSIIADDIDSEVSQEFTQYTNSSDCFDLFEDEDVLLQENQKDGTLNKKPEPFEEACALITKVQKVTKEVIIEREKDIKKKIISRSGQSVKNGKRKITEEVPKNFQHSAKILKLKEEIAGLNNEIVTAKKRTVDNDAIRLKRLQEMRELQNLSMDFEDDSSSCSDDEFYEEIGLGRESFSQELDEPLSSRLHAESTDVNRVVHKQPGRSKLLKSKRQEKPKPLPKRLMTKTPSSGPCPEHALICLTPGVGYIDVLEFDHKKVVIQDPETDNVIHEFSDSNQAAEWLNSLFELRFTVKTSRKMQWLKVKGSLIRYLQPLNREIFKFPAKQVQVTKDGLETPMSVKQELRNQLERERRLELSQLQSELADLVIPHEVTKDQPRIAVNTTLKYAHAMIEVQGEIKLELAQNALELSRKKSELTTKIRQLIASFSDRSKAVKICKNVLNQAPPIKGHRISKYITQMTELELTRLGHKMGLTTISNGSSPGSTRTSEEASRRICEEVMEMHHKSLPVKANTSDNSKLKKNCKTNKDVVILVDSDEGEKNDETVIEIASDESEEDAVIWLESEKPVESIDDDVEIVCENIRRPNITVPKPKKRPPPSTRKKKTTRNEPLKGWARRNNLKSLDIPLKRPVPGSSAIISRVSQETQTQPEVIDIDDEVVIESEEETEVFVDRTVSGCSRTDPVSYNKHNRSETFLPLEASSRINLVGVLEGSSTTSSFRVDQERAPPTDIFSIPSISPSVSSVRHILPKPSVIQENIVPQASSGSKVLECRNIRPIGKINPDNNKFIGKSVLIKLPTSGAPLSAATAVAPTVPRLLSPERENTVTLYHPSQEVSETRRVQFSRTVPTVSTFQHPTNTCYKPQHDMQITPFSQGMATPPTNNQDRAITLYQPHEEMRQIQPDQFGQTLVSLIASQEGSQARNEASGPPHAGPKIRRPKGSSGSLKFLLPKRN